MTMWKTAIIATASLLVGLVTGAIGGFNVATNNCKHMMDPLLVLTGDQARNTLVFLEKGTIDEYTGYLEKEVSRSLDYLDYLERQGEIPSGSPMLHIQKRLREYRASHPIEEALATVDTKEE